MRCYAEAYAIRVDDGEHGKLLPDPQSGLPFLFAAVADAEACLAKYQQDVGVAFVSEIIEVGIDGHDMLRDLYPPSHRKRND